jgi:hypothetical protein
MTPSEIPIPGFRRPLELRRAARAAFYNVQLLDDGLYLVMGGREPHHVRLDPYPECDCGDNEWTDSTCVHLCAVLEFGGNTEVIRLREEYIRLETDRLAEKEARRQEREQKKLAREAKRAARIRPAGEA